MTDQQVQNFKTQVTYSLLGIGTATGLVFAARHFLQKFLQNKAQDSSLIQGDPSAYATQLKMAFDNDNYFGWGTNTTAVFNVFAQIPAVSFYKKVQRAYKNEYNRDLNADLQSELSSSEYNSVINILNAKR